MVNVSEGGLYNNHPRNPNHKFEAKREAGSGGESWDGWAEEAKSENCKQKVRVSALLNCAKPLTDVSPT